MVPRLSSMGLQAARQAAAGASRAVLLIQGLRGPGDHVWQSGKAAARLQAASTSGKPVLLRLDGQAGHGIGSTAQQQTSKLADIYAFLLWQFAEAAKKP